MKKFFLNFGIIFTISCMVALFVETRNTIPREYQINYTIGNQKVTYVTKAYFMNSDNGTIEFRDEHGINHRVSGTFEIVYIK